VGLNRCPTEELKSLEGVLSPRAQSERNSRSLGLWRWLWLLRLFWKGGLGFLASAPSASQMKHPIPQLAQQLHCSQCSHGSSPDSPLSLLYIHYVKRRRNLWAWTGAASGAASNDDYTERIWGNWILDTI